MAGDVRVESAPVARAPLPEIEAYKKRMGWRFKWVSSHGSDFNHDFHVSFTRDAAGDIFHSFSTCGRRTEELIGPYVAFDLTPKGRNESGSRHSLTD